MTSLHEDPAWGSLRARSTSVRTAWYGKNDEHALVAIARGDLTAARDTGLIDYQGKPAGTAQADGYITVSIRRYAGRGWVTIGAHRIAWMYFHAPIPPGMVVNHRNGRRWDNRFDNLELTTHADNIRHAHRLPYAAVGDHDDNSVSEDWFNQVRLLVASGNVATEQIAALIPETEPSQVDYYGGAKVWRNPRGRRGEERRAS